MTERTLVTGVTGFVGSRVAARWIASGRHVRGLVRQDVALPGVEVVVGDIGDPATSTRAVDGVDVVIHCAVDQSDDPVRMRRVNEGGTRALAEAAIAAGCRRFVHISSCGAYALEGLDLITEETPLWPEARIDELTYGVTKAMGERALAETVGWGLTAIILRPANVLGPHGRSVFCRTLAEGVRDGTIGYAGDGGNTWPYVHVENLVDAVESAVDAEHARGRAYTVVDGHTTWRAYLEHHAAWFGVEVSRRERRSLYDDFRGRFATGRIRDELGYEPRLTYEDALDRTRRYLEHVGVVAPSAV